MLYMALCWKWTLTEMIMASHVLVLLRDQRPFNFPDWLVVWATQSGHCALQLSPWMRRRAPACHLRPQAASAGMLTVCSIGWTSGGTFGCEMWDISVCVHVFILYTHGQQQYYANKHFQNCTTLSWVWLVNQVITLYCLPKIRIGKSQLV